MKMSAQRINTTKHLATPKHTWSSDESPLRRDSPLVDQDPLTHPQGSLIICISRGQRGSDRPCWRSPARQGAGVAGDVWTLLWQHSHTANLHSILPGKDSLNKLKACLCETASLFWESSQEGK